MSERHESDRHHKEGKGIEIDLGTGQISLGGLFEGLEKLVEAAGKHLGGSGPLSLQLNDLPHGKIKPGHIRRVDASKGPADVLGQGLFHF